MVVDNTPRQPRWQLVAVLYASSFLLHFIWEMWQIPFYIDMLSASHWAGVVRCSQATLGDGTIALIAYGVAAIPSRSWFWLQRPTATTTAIYLLVGLSVTVVLEYLAVDVLNQWRYSELMPRLPVTGTGVLPLLQWIVIPPCVLWLSKVILNGLTK